MGGLARDRIPANAYRCAPALQLLVPQLRVVPRVKWSRNCRQGLRPSCGGVSRERALLKVRTRQDLSQLVLVDCLGRTLRHRLG
jgi:hypothetical protein